MSEMMTARLGLPMLAAGQAQKEVTHNEALLLIDSLLVPTSEAAPQNAAPVSPAAGQCWLVGAAPTGVWAGQAHALASWTAAGWRFVDLPIGSEIMVAVDEQCWRRISTGWQAPAMVTPASGGAVIDSECRTVLSALINALVDRGLIATA